MCFRIYAKLCKSGSEILVGKNYAMPERQNDMDPDQRCGKQTIWIRIRVGEMVWIQYTGWKNYANPDQGYELEKLCKMIRIRIRDAGKQNDMD